MSKKYLKIKQVELHWCENGLAHTAVIFIVQPYAT